MSNDRDNHDVEEIDCLQAIGLLYEYLDGQLHDLEARRKYEHHLQHCRHCFSRSEMEKELNKRLKTSTEDGVPASLQKRLKDILNDF